FESPEGGIFITAGRRPAESTHPTLCLKGKTSPAFQAVSLAVVARRSPTCGYENQAFQAFACDTHFGVVKIIKY
ncbi:MAG: hypothetical protein LBQ84_02000, partial [Flavobacteriaceae bacterium]|nr:hypothetical protein [Flavobacteriaceae bacterium]